MDYDDIDNSNTGTVQLRVFGITYNPVQSGAYALLLGEVNGNRRIPVVVGTAEARSIAMAVEHIVPQRPITHDLMLHMMELCGITLDEVFIYEFDEGIFKSRILISQNGVRHAVDSRTSDAIALALRTGAPIFTTPEIVRVTGIVFDTGSAAGGKHHHKTLRDLTVEQLQHRLDVLVEREEYEQAAEVQKVIRSKQQAAGDAAAEHPNTPTD